VQLHWISIAANLTIALGFLSSTIAVGLYSFRHRSTKWGYVLLALAALCGAIAVSRLLTAAGLWLVKPMTVAEVTVEVIFAVLAVLFAVLVWPLLRHSVTFQHIETLQQSQDDLKEDIRHQERLFRLAVSAVKDYAIFLLDTEGYVQTWNEGAQRIKGYTASEILGKHFSILYTREAQAEGIPQTNLEAAKREGRCQYQGWRQRKDGSLFWADIDLTAVYSEQGELRGFLKVTRDMTREKELEINHLKQHEQLQIARDKALEASNMKSAFVANISHELRTPLAGILGMNELLMITDLNEDQQMMASAVQQSGQSLLDIVNDILDLAKIEAGRLVLHYAPFDPRILVEESVGLLAAAAATQGIEIRTNIDKQLPPSLIGDAARIKQVLLNLLGNAVKFTTHGSVDVSIELVDRSDQVATLKFTVKDTGVGIRDAAKSHLFTPFRQGDTSNSRRFGGTGLGLAISRDLVEKMQGQIDFESQEHVGSTFWFIIPLPESAAAQKPPEVPPSIRQERKYKSA
jgi:osomolarity two-component system sensor histidine kinase TcsA